MTLYSSSYCDLKESVSFQTNGLHATKILLVAKSKRVVDYTTTTTTTTTTSNNNNDNNNNNGDSKK